MLLTCGLSLVEMIANKLDWWSVKARGSSICFQSVVFFFFIDFLIFSLRSLLVLMYDKASYFGFCVLHDLLLGRLYIALFFVWQSLIIVLGADFEYLVLGEVSLSLRLFMSFLKYYAKCESVKCILKSTKYHDKMTNMIIYCICQHERHTQFWKEFFCEGISR